MSKDSSPNHIHFHHPRLADLFEDFNRPYTSIFASNASTGTGASSSNAHNPAAAPPPAPTITPAPPLLSANLALGD
ncbi:hypothetical protein ACJ72_00145 [Emergomyces africanus]|uniref:Uncharacterized protein n=1 Tax=Emergomyces africanus TaxID=1955775 RepID=A0A1B7P8W3_9EURO|nr:hypothetical protein ACJ72_00145 [Emergomyces africanus]